MLEVCFSSLRRLPLTVTGAWTDSPTGPRWSGRASAPEPLAAIAFLTTAGETRWCRSSPPAPDGLEVDLLWWFGSATDPRGSLVARFGQGGSGQLQTLLTGVSRDARPAIPTPWAVHTGELRTVVAWPQGRLSVLFVAGSDVRGARNRLWHVRPAAAEGVEEPYRRPFTYGRAGRIPAR
jgi:hypothetical protein